MAMASSLFRGVDLGVVALCVAVAVVCWQAIWSERYMGLPMNTWFGWHPVLMIISYPCLMVLGRYAYAVEPSFGLETKESRRMMHLVLMVLATAAALGGYVAIYKAHVPMKKFGGYHFDTKTWDDWEWLLHVWLGYSIILLSVLQAIMGALKAYRLLDERKSFAFHGNLGKVIIVGGCLNAAIGTHHWSWGPHIKSVLYVLILACGVFGSIYPSFAARSSGEGQRLLPPKAEAADAEKA